MTTAILTSLINSVVLGSLVAATVTIVLRLMPRRALNAATRYAIWWLTLPIVVALPVMRVSDDYFMSHPLRAIAHWGTPSHKVAPPATHYVPPVSEGATADSYPEPDSAVSAAPVQPDTRPTTTRPIFAVPVPESRWPRVIVGIGGLLAAIMLLRLLVSCILLERTKSRALFASPDQSLRVNRWLALCGSRRKKIRLKTSCEISCPVASGPFRTAILVPSGFFEDLSDTEIDQAGLHETAHFARHDDFALLLQRIVEAVLCWHPAIRWITRQIDLEREIACDDFVVEMLRQPRSYASCLTRLAELAARQRPPLMAAGAIAKGSHLTRRVELLLDRTRHTGTRLLRFRFAGLALVPLLLALGATRIPQLIAFAQPSPARPQKAAPARPLPDPQPIPQPAPQESNTADPTVEEWIKSNAIPLSTVDAGNGFADMQPLKKIIGNARIVALGDATLGTHEVFRMKHRILEFLATEMGFNVFTMAANMPEAYRLNDYVLNGNGNPSDLLKGIYFPCWDTKEVLDMAEWMREFNKSGRGRVEFTGMDMQTPDVAGKIVRDFAGKYDPEYLSVIQKAPYASATAPRFTSDTGTFPIADAAGKTVRLSANIKTEDVTDYANLWWRADGEKDGKMKPLAFKNLGNAAPKGTTGWKHYQLEIDVPAQTQNINFGVSLSGGGAAWFDDLEVEIDGQPYTKARGFDLLSTGRALPKSKFPIAAGYEASFDSQETSGATGPTLQLKRIAPLDSASANQPKEAATNWREILDHMESSRSLYAAHGASSNDLEWAIQNARVVLQSIQLKTGEITRDAAMAVNAKWILDHSPSDTRMVIWTHNEHVATHLHDAMGAALRKMYPNDLVSFGFLFNQGSFRTWERNRDSQTATVPPAPSGSFEATLASTGIPLFALDLRHASGPAAVWMNQPHTSRRLGTGYSEEQPEKYFWQLVPQSTFDAVFFMDNTTATVAEISPSSASIVNCTASGASQLCRDKEYAVSFSLPAGWTVDRTWRWGDRQNTVALNDPQQIPGQRHPSLWYTVRLTPAKQTPAETLAELQKSAEFKVLQRQQAGITGYHIRPNSCHAHNVGSLPGWSCIGEFTDATGIAMTEYLTWADSGTAQAEFFGYIPASGLNAYLPRLDAIMETLQLP